MWEKGQCRAVLRGRQLSPTEHLEQFAGHPAASTHCHIVASHHGNLRPPHTSTHATHLLDGGQQAVKHGLGLLLKHLPGDHAMRVHIVHDALHVDGCLAVGGQHLCNQTKGACEGAPVCGGERWGLGQAGGQAGWRWVLARHFRARGAGHVATNQHNEACTSAKDSSHREGW